MRDCQEGWWMSKGEFEVVWKDEDGGASTYDESYA